MSPTEIRIHGEMFRRAWDYYISLFPGQGPKLTMLNDRGFYRTMEEVLGSRRPRAYYSNSPLVTYIVFSLVSMMPRCDLILIRFIVSDRGYNDLQWSKLSVTS